MTPHGHYEFLRMPFGMKNSGVTLCRCMDELLADFSNADNYVDDTLVHTQTWDLHKTVPRKCLDAWQKLDLLSVRRNA